MGFFKQLTDLFGDQPLRLRMELADEGVQVGIWRGNRLLSADELRAEKILRKLPAPLAQLVINSPAFVQPGYLLRFPVAKDLCKRLQNAPTQNLSVDCQAVDSLQIIQPPPTFELRWIYNPLQHALERQILGADRHLGEGWFQKDQLVWGPSDDLEEDVAQILRLPRITGPAIELLVTRIIPELRQVNLSAYSPLLIRTDYTVQLKIMNMLGHSMDVELVSTPPNILRKAEYLAPDSTTMISGDVLLPGLRPLLSERLLRLAHSGGVQRISSEDLPLLIQEAIRPNATRLGVDMRKIDEKYPIVDAAQGSTTWTLDYRREQGVGRFYAVPLLVVSGQQLPLSMIVARVQAGNRFFPVETGWLEFTPTFKRRLEALIASRVEEFYFYPREILGTYLSRLSFTKLAIPEAVIPTGNSPIENAQFFLEALRQRGVPAGISGLQIDIFGVLTRLYATLLREYPAARILWIVPKRKWGSARQTLRDHTIPFHEGGSRLPPTLDGQVMLASPEQRLSPGIDWTCVIFHDLDTLVASDDGVRYMGPLRRRWSVATFSRPDWYQIRSVPQIMQVLQLAHEDLSAFHNKWSREFPPQSEDLLKRLTSPFKQVLANTTIDTGVIPIPPRASPPPPPAPTPEPKVITKFIGKAQAKPRPSFLSQAQQYANRSEQFASFVPFQHYWPTYADMEPAQQRWYFYWRTRLRQGEFLTNDLSYLFVYVYELLHLIGFTNNAPAAWKQLVKFWKYYRGLQPRLDGYLLDWLADFTAVYKLPHTPLDWYGAALEAQATISNSDLALEAWLKRGGDFTELSNDLLYGIAKYSPTQNKFYQQHNATMQLDLAYRKGLQAVDSYIRKHKGMPLVDLYKVPTPKTITRVPFANAVYEGNREPVKIADVYMRTTSTALADQLAAIIKYTENMQRKQAGFKSKLRGFELPIEWVAAIDKAFIVQAPRREIAVDMSSVSALQLESEALRRRLIIEESQAASASQPSIEAIPVPQAAAQPGYTLRPADAPTGLLTDLVPVAALMGDSASLTATLLRALQTHHWEASASALQITIGEGYFLNVELDKLNERALEQIGDSLIIGEGDKLVVAEDYRDEIEYILGHPEYAGKATEPDNSSSVPAIEYTELGAELAAFAQHLKPQHWEAIAVLVDGADIAVRLDAVARSVGATPGVLLDDINGFALDSIGDIVINTGGDQPTIEGDNREGLRRLLAWAAQHSLLEN